MGLLHFQDARVPPPPVRCPPLTLSRARSLPPNAYARPPTHTNTGYLYKDEPHGWGELKHQCWFLCVVFALRPNTTPPPPSLARTHALPPQHTCTHTHTPPSYHHHEKIKTSPRCTTTTQSTPTPAGKSADATSGARLPLPPLPAARTRAAPSPSLEQNPRRR